MSKHRQFEVGSSIPCDKTFSSGSAKSNMFLFKAKICCSIHHQAGGI
jgi:hypothetical protein